MYLPDIEVVSAKVHRAWMDSKKRQGTFARQAEDGEELMVPYEALSEKAKDLDRSSVKAVYDAIEAINAEKGANLLRAIAMIGHDVPTTQKRMAEAEALGNEQGRDACAKLLGYGSYQAYDRARDTAHGR